MDRLRRLEVDGDKLAVRVDVEGCELLDWDARDLADLAVYHLNNNCLDFYYWLYWLG